MSDARTHAVVQLAVYCDSQQSAHASSNHQSIRPSIRPNATYSRHIGCISASAAAAELVVDVCGNVIDTARLSASTNNTNPSSFINTSSSSSAGPPSACSSRTTTELCFRSRFLSVESYTPRFIASRSLLAPRLTGGSRPKYLGLAPPLPLSALLPHHPLRSSPP